MKNYSVILMPAAKGGLLGIGEYIALDNPIRAMSFIDELTSSLKNTLSIFPYAGRVERDLEFSEEIRMLPYDNYISYYRIVEDKKTVEILFIFHAGRDLEKLVGGI